VAVEVDITDWCGADCTRVFLYSGALTVDTTSSASSGEQTLRLVVGDNAVDRLAVSSCEARVNEIRFTLEPVAIEPMHWDTVKVLYRGAAQ